MNHYCSKRPEFFQRRLFQQYRRICVVGARRDEGRLTKPIPDAQSQRRELLKSAPKRPSARIQRTVRWLRENDQLERTWSVTDEVLATVDTPEAALRK
jgi:hypothetical protein